MHKILIAWAGSSIGTALAESMSESHEIWTTSNRSEFQLPTRNIRWDAASEAFPADWDWLPETLDELVYCPGSIRLAPFQSSR